MHCHAGNDNVWHNLLSHPETCIFCDSLRTNTHIYTYAHWHTSLPYDSIEWNVPKARTIFQHVEFLDLIVFSVFRWAL